MKQNLILSLAGLLAISCMTLSHAVEKSHQETKVNEIDAVIGQWDYDLLTKDGVKIKGFFQVEPANKSKLPVVGQAYFDKGEKTLSAKNLRGVWTGSLQKDKQNGLMLTFVMKGNPVFPSTPAEEPYRGTIYFHLTDGTLDGTFKDHDSREGVAGTITAHRHQQS